MPQSRNHRRDAQIPSPPSEAVNTDPHVDITNGKKQDSEERRRQLNRRAQKAFRERRTEHMAYLEASIEQMTKELHAAQLARSNAVDEVMMVKYKNSLLERLLLENGIDVHKELSNPYSGCKQKGTLVVESLHRNRRKRDVSGLESNQSPVPRKVRKQAHTRPGSPEPASITYSVIQEDTRSPGSPERHSHQQRSNPYAMPSTNSPKLPGKSPFLLSALLQELSGPRLTLCFRTRYVFTSNWICT